MEDNARLFALLNLAMADAAICAWDAKCTVSTAESTFAPPTRTAYRQV
jgi:hypothetical protein